MFRGITIYFAKKKKLTQYFEYSPSFHKKTLPASLKNTYISKFRIFKCNFYAISFLFLFFSLNGNLLSGSRCVEYAARVVTFSRETTRFSVKKRSEPPAGGDTQRHGGSDRLAAPLHVRLKRSVGNSHANVVALKCFSVASDVFSRRDAPDLQTVR